MAMISLTTLDTRLFSWRAVDNVCRSFETCWLRVQNMPKKSGADRPFDATASA
ncbi:hypothetical protein KCP75_13460 [Salmonella enterica subsp. enterica]|nr:hypothetical protein KCP75_13460 [Salmonella enterica subsp. enterica]